MAGKTSIEWTRGDDGSPGATWNPTTGCDKVSPGCDHCYAMTLAKRLKGMGSRPYQEDGDPATSGPGFLAHEWPNALGWPLHQKRPKRIFVNSMSDLFHKNITDDYIARVFAVMSLCPQHTFQVLTKRPARMRALLSRPEFPRMVLDAKVGPRWTPLNDAWWPLPNVWGGVSVEDQDWTRRVDALLRTPFAVRFLSVEPMLGPVCLDPWHTPHDDGRQHCDGPPPAGIHWLICGGESGPGARPMQLDWARSLRDQCRAAGVPFLFKQWGNWAPQGLSVGHIGPREHLGEIVNDGKYTDLTWRRLYRNVGKKAAGRVLDGRTWDEYPSSSSVASTEVKP